jgi:hypothetical protein
MLAPFWSFICPSESIMTTGRPSPSQEGLVRAIAGRGIAPLQLDFPGVSGHPVYGDQAAVSSICSGVM